MSRLTYISPIWHKSATNSKFVIFGGETSKGFEVLKFSMNATSTQLLSSVEFCKQCYDTIPAKSESANDSFYTNNLKMPNFELWLSCCKWETRCGINNTVF
jgi:hypothetical protein